MGNIDSFLAPCHAIHTHKLYITHQNDMILGNNKWFINLPIPMFTPIPNQVRSSMGYDGWYKL